MKKEGHDPVGRVIVLSLSLQLIPDVGTFVGHDGLLLDNPLKARETEKMANRKNRAVVVQLIKWTRFLTFFCMT